jgi:ribosomal protein S25
VSVEDYELSRLPSTRKREKMFKIREMIHEDRRRTIHVLADTAGIGYGVRQKILTKHLNMRRIAAKFVPRL